MKVILDIEANGLKPTEIWCIVCKELGTCHKWIFRKVTQDVEELERFRSWSKEVSCWIGHNLLGYDLPNIVRLCNVVPPKIGSCIDTLIVSKLVDYPRQGHSVKDYGIEFGLYKGEWTDYKNYSEEAVSYCERDVDITEKIYEKYKKYIDNPKHRKSLLTEHTFQVLGVNNLENNGFAFDTPYAQKQLGKVEKELSTLDEAILAAFPPRSKLIREINPKLTKHGTLNRTDFRFLEGGDLSDYNGGAFSRFEWVAFNPGSPKQIVGVLAEAGWSPIDKTKGHIQAEREVNKLQRQRRRTKELDVALQDAIMVLERLRLTGWKTNENNLATLPKTAPPAARLLAQRILYEARRKTLTEWINLVCLEIKIENESIDVLGHAIKDHLIQNGVPRNKNITEKDLEKEIWNWLENPTVILKTFLGQKENVGGISNLPTELLLKIIINYLKSKQVNVSSVEETVNSTSITVIPQEKLEGSSAKIAIQILDGLKIKGLRYSVTSARVKGKFFGIGTWPHRMAHQKPNMANIPNAVRVSDGKASLLGKELRSCWVAPKGRLLVGVDAEAIQLRGFAHLINDPVLIDAIVNGNKKLGTDPHSLNQTYFGSYCKTRNAAKHSLYAMFFGGTASMLSLIMGCTRAEAQEAIDALIKKYPGLERLQKEVFPIDARRGYFVGVDGRKVRIPGDTVRDREHLCMAGYLQNFEKVIMAMATNKFVPGLKHYDSFLVDLVHDEWQNECPNNYEICEAVAKLECQSLVDVGVELELNCPLAGSYFNDAGKPTFGRTWYATH